MTIHDLQEHESMLVEITRMGILQLGNGIQYPYVWQVTRVATGWIYQNANPNVPAGSFFVPLTYYTNPTI